MVQQSRRGREADDRRPTIRLKRRASPDEIGDLSDGSCGHQHLSLVEDAALLLALHVGSSHRMLLGRMGWERKSIGTPWPNKVSFDYASGDKSPHISDHASCPYSHPRSYSM